MTGEVSDARSQRHRVLPGKHPLSKQFIDEHRRQRCALAIAELVCEVGVHGLNTQLITTRARIGRATFYELFDGRKDAFRWACDYAGAQLTEPIEAAARTRRDWPDRVRASIGALVGTAAASPDLAELYLVHSIAGRKPEALEDHGVPVVTRVLADALAPPQADSGTRERLLAYGAVSVLCQRVLERDTARLAPLVGELTTLVMLMSGQKPVAGTEPASP